MSAFQAASKQVPRALRLTFTYEGEKVSLVERQPIEKRTRQTDPILKEGEASQYSGFWIELHDAKNRTIYRRVLHNPIQFSVEVPSDKPHQSFERHTIENPRGTFFVIVPDLDQAESIVIFNSPLDPEFESRAGSREIARIDFKEACRQDKDPGKEK